LGRNRPIDSNDGIYCTVLVEIWEWCPKYLQLYTLAGSKTDWTLRVTTSTTGGLIVNEGYASTSR